MQERSEAERRANGHALMLLLGEESEATEPYNKYTNLFNYIKLIDQFDQPILSTLLSPM